MENILSGGLWIIPTVTGIAAVWSSARYFKSKQKGALVYAISFFAATVLILWAMLNDK